MKLIKFAVASLIIAQLHLNAETPVLQNNVEATTEVVQGVCPFKMSCHQSKQERSNITFNHLSNYNNFFGATNLTAGTAIPFNGTPVQSGSIVQSTGDAFTFTRSGHYYINVVTNPSYSTIGAGIVLVVDGAIIAPGTSINYGDTPLILQQIVPIIASPILPATLQVIVTGTSLNFPDGPGASISIIELSSLGHQ